ncbi:cytochrome P450 [Penicillium nucicola]|uniref:cytochrome P450 n=1 Tax=Penicillium nucicola TaxID=1850975 RepID=UPI002544E91B|nr:cytochrome P450 [Penicillium nucicola]KAJ5762320.1 cytochrome P450 [Penicillium nucicola]
MGSLHSQVVGLVGDSLPIPNNIQSCTLLVTVLFIVYTFTSSVITALKPGLRLIPGPIIARFSSLYRPWKIAKGDAPDFYLRLHKKYGPIVRTGPKTSPFYDTFSPSYEGETMPSMFSVRDPVQHQALRRPVAQKFSMSSIKALEPFADECTKIFIDAMHDLEGQCVDIGVWLQWYAFDVIGAITFQRRFEFMEKRTDVGGMIEALDNGLHYAGIVSQVPALHHWLMGNQWVAKFLSAQPFVEVLDPLRTIVQFTQQCIDDYDRKPAEHGNRPDFLAWLRGEEAKGKPMPNRDMINHLSNNLLAGSDTTGISLRAIIYYLVKNKSVYRKLQAEVDNADQAGKLSEYVTYAECLELPYLQAVMKEALRCHPGVQYPLERVVPKGGTTLCGVHIDAGTIVGMNPTVMHHDTTIFGGDAGSFRPERWTESNHEHIKLMDRHLMTFGYGSRTCIGKNISIMEMGKLVPQIIRHFEIEWDSDKSDWRVETFWFAKQHGLKCRLRSRAK